MILAIIAIWGTLLLLCSTPLKFFLRFTASTYLGGQDWIPPRTTEEGWGFVHQVRTPSLGRGPAGITHHALHFSLPRGVTAPMVGTVHCGDSGDLSGPLCNLSTWRKFSLSAQHKSTM